MPYSTVDDLLIGDLPLGSKIDRGKFVQDAADEMDSSLGFRYVTPIDTSATARHVTLLLKRINNHLASGRLILAVSIGGEDTTLQAYGVSLIQDAIAALSQILAGMVLEGAETVDPTDTTSGPNVVNEDESSGVAAFYDLVMKPVSSGVAPWWEPGQVP